MKTLFVCFDGKSVERLEKKMLAETEKIVLAMYSGAKRELEKIGVKYLIPEQFHKLNEVTETQSLEMADKILGKISSQYDFTYSNTQLPKLYSTDLGLRLYQVYLRQIKLLLNVLEKNKVGKIVSHASTDADKQILEGLDTSNIKNLSDIALHSNV